MEAMAVQLSGSFERSALEHTLTELIRTHGLVRLKGRLWLAGKALPLQIQAAGPRLECWFEGMAGTSGAPGLELVLMGFGLDRQAIESRLMSLAA
jgi:cobalamin biosynthesis protein CobW